MARYKKYTNPQDGKQYYEFQAYLGTNELTGKPVRVTRRRNEETGKPFRSKAQAEKEVKRLEEEFRTGRMARKKTQTPFAEVYAKWLRQYKKEVRASTFAHTERQFRSKILPHLGDVIVERATKRHMDEVVAIWMETVPNNFKALINFTKRVFDYAIYLEVIEDNPMGSVLIPKTRKKSPKTSSFFERDELMEFLELAYSHGGEKSGRKWGMLFHLIAFTGCRKGEALALTWDDVDLDERTITFNKTLSKISRVDGNNEVVVNDTTKNGEARTISLDEWTVRRLRTWEEERRGRLMFPAELNARTHIHPDLITTTMRRLSKKMQGSGRKKDVTPHGLRHTHCSLLFAAGRPVKEVQRRLGHKSSRVTLDVYAHVTAGKEVEAADAFLAFVSQGKKKLLMSEERRKNDVNGQQPNL